MPISITSQTSTFYGLSGSQNRDITSNNLSDLLERVNVLHQSTNFDNNEKVNLETLKQDIDSYLSKIQGGGLVKSGIDSFCSRVAKSIQEYENKDNIRSKRRMIPAHRINLRSDLNEETHSQVTVTDADFKKLKEELTQQINEMREERQIENALSKANAIHKYACALINRGIQLNNIVTNPGDLSPLQEETRKLQLVISEFNSLLQQNNRTATATKSVELISLTNTCENKIRTLYTHFHDAAQQYKKEKISAPLSHRSLEIQMDMQAEDMLEQMYPNLLIRTVNRLWGEKTRLYQAAKAEVHQNLVDVVGEKAIQKYKLISFFKKVEPPLS